MAQTNEQKIRLLLVDDEEEFRQSTTKVLSRRGFMVKEASNGVEALKIIGLEKVDAVLLDLKMPGMDGITTLGKIRETEPNLPVIILTGHGDFNQAVAGIKLEIVDFLQKPFEVEQLAQRLTNLLTKKKQPLTEKSIAQLMKPATAYKKVYSDQSVQVAVSALWESFAKEGPESEKLRSILVYERQGHFIGMVRFHDMLKLVLPHFLKDSPYASFFTGMFLAQCKLIGKREIIELIEDTTSVDVNAPLIEAVHLMVTHHLVNLPVMKDGTLVGVLRERDIIKEIADFVIE